VPPDTGDYETVAVGQIGLWRDDGQYALGTDRILALGLDALLVNYEGMLVNQEPLCDLARRFPGPTGIVYHDACIRPDFDHSAFDLHFSHRWNVGPPNALVIPFGIEDRPPIVRTFGLGRTRSDLVRPICERNGWVFEDIASHEPIHGGGQEWRTHEQLVNWLRGADAIVLWYDPQPMAGSSQAARTAMASRRPVVTNNTEWFSDLPRVTGTEYSGHHYKQVSDLIELERYLEVLLQRPYAEENSWDRVAAKLVERYQSVMANLEPKATR
jgi:hypothetical protein